VVEEMRYFIKLIFLNNSAPALLYGFCGPTDKPLRNWQEMKRYWDMGNSQTWDIGWEL